MKILHPIHRRIQFCARIARAALLFAGAALPLTAAAQWAAQSIPLAPGWNAVYLEVEPADPDADAVFAGLPIESVWAWNPRSSPMQFLTDPETLLPRQAEWLTYFPPSHPQSAVRNLFSIRGARAYLIKLGGLQTVNWNMVGKPVPPAIEWVPDSYNLVGFHVSESAPPTFQSFFAASPSHAGQSVFRLGASGSWSRVSNPATETIQRGRAYWVRCAGGSDYTGPLKLVLDQPDGIPFGRILGESEVRLQNLSSNSTREVTVRVLDSVRVDSSAQPVLAGPVPLSLWRSATNRALLPEDGTGASTLAYGFAPWTGPVSLVLSNGDGALVRLAVRRADMAPFTPPPRRPALYQSLLEIVDPAGMRLLVPVSAVGIGQETTAGTGGGLALAAAGASPHPYRGLWVGEVRVTHVNQPSHPSDANALRPVRTDFPLRLILHVNDAGQVTFLPKVLVAWKNGTYQPDPRQPGVLIPDQPGGLVLATDETVAARFQGATLRDGKQVPRRLSTAAFGLTQPVSAESQTGTFGDGSVAFRLATGYNDPLNPFKHRYHPDHDNLDAEHQGPLAADVESFNIVRRLQLTFTPTDPEGQGSPAWRDSQLGGTYLETIAGVHKDLLRVGGTFRLHRLSDVSTLNDTNL